MPGEQPAQTVGLDPVIHAQSRLRVMAALSALGADAQLSFPRLQELLGMTAGNLSTHLRKLEEAGYVLVTKAHRRRTPVTYLALTGSGRRAFDQYTAALRSLLTPPTDKPDTPSGPPPRMPLEKASDTE